MFLSLLKKYLLSNSIKIVVLPTFFIFQIPVYAETCDERLSAEKKKFNEEIEAKFTACGKDKECRNKVQELGKNRPYVKAFKECVKNKKDEIKTTVEG
jgi:guanylate kinase